MGDKIKKHLETSPTVYVSIRGLKIHGLKSFIPFWWFAIRSKIQADRAVGILFSDVRKINGIQHTLTAWKTKDSMKSFLYSGAHLHAIRAFRKIATGKTFGFEAAQLPTWDQVHELWSKHGKEY